MTTNLTTISIERTALFMSPFICFQLLPRIKLAMVTTEPTSVLTYYFIYRLDSGKYTVLVMNVAGSKSCDVDVVILDVPSHPSNLISKDLRKDSVVLSWNLPDCNGGSPITGYIVEKKESTKKSWVPVTSSCLQNTFKVCLLNC